MEKCLILVLMVCLVLCGCSSEIVDTSSTHIHSFDSEYVYDSTYHYKTCECGEISDKVIHDFNNDSGICVCGVSIEECSNNKEAISVSYKSYLKAPIGFKAKIEGIVTSYDNPANFMSIRSNDGEYLIYIAFNKSKCICSVGERIEFRGAKTYFNDYPELYLYNLNYGEEYINVLDSEIHEVIPLDITSEILSNTELDISSKYFGYYVEIKNCVLKKIENRVLDTGTGTRLLGVQVSIGNNNYLINLKNSESINEYESIINSMESHIGEYVNIRGIVYIDGYQILIKDTNFIELVN